MHSLMFSFWFMFQISILDIKYYLKRKCFCLFLCNSFCSNFHYKLLVKFDQDTVIKNIVKILKSIIDKFMDFFFTKCLKIQQVYSFFSRMIRQIKRRHQSPMENDQVRQTTTRRKAQLVQYSERHFCFHGDILLTCISKDIEI